MTVSLLLFAFTASLPVAMFCSIRLWLPLPRGWEEWRVTLVFTFCAWMVLFVFSSTMGYLGG